MPTALLAEYVDLLRAKSVCIDNGARVIPLTTKKTSLATVLTDPVPAWRLELGAVAESEPTFGTLPFQARTLACIVPVSRERVADSVSIEAFLPNVLAKTTALELDRVWLVGSGSALEPRGIYNTTGIGGVAARGALTSYDKLLDVLQTLQEANAQEPYTYVMPPRTSTALAKLKAATTNEPLPVPPELQNVVFESTTQVPNDFGTGNDESIIVGGDFRECWLGVRMEATVELLKELYAADYQYGFMVSMRADVQLAHQAAFCKLTGITAT